MAKPLIAYKTGLGTMYQGLAEEVLASSIGPKHEKRVQLILTSPPFPLNNKKKYGNLQGAAYIEWLASFALVFRKFLKKNGSIVIEMGNAWEPGQPVMSTLTPKALIAFQERGQLNLCQQFICHNPARLPSPAQWVNVERIRVKDAFTHLWWMAPTARPKANNRSVLKPYSSSMLQLLKSGKYNSGKRPSEHQIGESSFLKNNNGAIPSNVLTIANTRSTDSYQRYCRKQDLQLHPARMPIELSMFFIKFLTKPGDLVLDPFAGSNTTGAAAEGLGRRWIAIEPNKDYVAGSKGRFLLRQKPKRI
jgi:DNA methylase